jgi:hypothetical protein
MRKYATVPLLVFCLLCMGMGAAERTKVVKDIPDPDRSFEVEIIDATDTSFHVEEFSVEGLTYVPVELGKAEVSLDFAAVESARFNLRDDIVAAEVRFADGRTRSVELDPGLTFYGRSEWGNLRLKARDIKKIHFMQE